MNTKEIQKAVAKMEVLSLRRVVCENISPLFRWEMDVMSISKSGMMYEFEVKISRSDFKADAKKGKKEFYTVDGLVTRWTPNYFSYACPTGLISLSEIGAGCGLYYIDADGITEIRPPQRLHKVKHDLVEISQKVVRLHQERIYLGCAMLTYENRLIKEKWERHEAQQRENLRLFDGQSQNNI